MTGGRLANPAACTRDHHDFVTYLRHPASSWLHRGEIGYALNFPSIAYPPAGRGGWFGGSLASDSVGWRRHAPLLHSIRDRKSVEEGQSVSVRVDLGGRRIIKKKTHKHERELHYLKKFLCY